MAATILTAWYGYHEKTRECTNAIKERYLKGEREFPASNNYVGDPAPGNAKTLVIVWEDVGHQNKRCGFTSEGDSVPIFVE
ncbi:hypothetical protein BamMEX5DRAFT_4143 [Burkholderia ambifaria MEX-5]|uniref:Uncharacterized protein n=1 Tax=Burkholderia ambifaria MEX-5 TaxID=396597 RepID=B1T8M7_9BURK|nr:hypothetical protein BamMEX5DRAFT_4143 [Burkholderia ambifaria MEX-5]